MPGKVRKTRRSHEIMIPQAGGRERGTCPALEQSHLGHEEQEKGVVDGGESSHRQRGFVD